VTSTSAHEATRSADCKVPNCTEPSAAMHGIYGRLCASHADQKRRERLEAGDAKLEHATKRPKGREDAIRAVLRAAREVDRQTKKLNALRKTAAASVVRVRDAKAELDRLEAAYSDAARDAGVGRPPERA
jgi:methylphosphotriester-DNA--protein-cysteine methyltransferase